jgi:hypothetical protein
MGITLYLLRTSFVFINCPSFTDFVLANGSYCSGVSYSVAERTDER